MFGIYLFPIECYITVYVQFINFEYLKVSNLIEYNRCTRKMMYKTTAYEANKAYQFDNIKQAKNMTRTVIISSYFQHSFVPNLIQFYYLCLINKFWWYESIEFNRIFNLITVFKRIMFNSAAYGANKAYQFDNIPVYRCGHYFVDWIRWGTIERFVRYCLGPSDNFTTEIWSSIGWIFWNMPNF